MRGRSPTLENFLISFQGLILAVRLRMKFRIRMDRTIRVDSWQMVILRLHPRSRIYIPHTKRKSNVKLLSISMDPKPRHESFNANLASGKKWNPPKVTITMVGKPGAYGTQYIDMPHWSAPDQLVSGSTVYGDPLLGSLRVLGSSGLAVNQYIPHQPSDWTRWKGV